MSESARSDGACVRFVGVSKRFGGVHAVEGVDLALHPGEVLGLLGHNGAGKSTLMKLLAGVHPTDAGEIRVGGRSVRLGSPGEARALGIETLYQDLALADNLDATANLFLGRERVRGPRWLGLLDAGRMQAEAEVLLERLAPGVPATGVPVARLSGGQRQAIALARAIHFRARVLIMDEPTAALGPAETARVHERVRTLRDEGLAIVLVSHDLHDVFSLADRIAVMWRGALVLDAPTATLDPEEVLGVIVGGRRSGSG